MQENSPEDNSLEELVLDAVDFARNFASDIAEHPLYIYSTAFLLHPTDSIIHRTFSSEKLHPDFQGAQCLQRMNAGLKRNICNMKSSVHLGPESLSRGLAFACQTWVEHVCTSVKHPSWVMKELGIFLCTHLLHWFEAMSIVKKAGEILPMLERTAAWLVVCLVISN